MAQKVLFAFNQNFPPKRAMATKLYFCYLKNNECNPKMFCAKNLLDDPNIISGGVDSKSLFVREFVFCVNLIKYIIKHRKDIEVLYIINPLLFCQPAIVIAKLIGIETVFDLRTGPIASGLKRIILKLFDYLHLLLADRIVTIDLKMLENIYGRHFIREAVELPEGFVSYVKPQVNSREKPFKYILSTTLAKVRRTREICKAFSGLKDYHLYIYGDGEDYEPLNAEFGKDENIYFMGHVTYEEIIKAMPTFDYGISYIPQTLYYEYQPPLKTIEYLGAGLPVIATRTHGNRIYVNEGNGIIINDNEEELRAAIQRITTIKFDRQKIHDNMMKFSWDNILQRAFSELAVIE